MAWAAAPVEDPARRAELTRLRADVERLRGELAGLAGHERGLLGELERLSAEAALGEAEYQEVAGRLAAVEAELGSRGEELARLEAVQDDRAVYLRARLREHYEAGPTPLLQRVLAGRDAADVWSALRYAVYLSARDGQVLRAWRSDAERLERDRVRLAATAEELGGTRDELARARARLEGARRRERARLEEVRTDQSQRRAAIAELEAAADGLGRVVDSATPAPAAAGLDVRKFRGLLDWPVDGRLAAGFGAVIHPRFKTRVPHPGFDVEAPFGADIRSVFDGTVVFSDWMRGYGLTVIVDHGAGMMSVYAHASATLVETGERVHRSQRLGTVGDTGSLRGPLLYFELRVDGKPVDPADWLRPR